MTDRERLAALSEPLAGLDLSEHEIAILEWLSGYEAAADVAELLWRARNAVPSRDRTVGAPPYDGAHPVRVALVLDALELLHSYGYHRGAKRSLASVLRTLNALVTAYEADKT